MAEGARRQLGTHTQGLRSHRAPVHLRLGGTLWKVSLQKLADETGLTLRVHHYPPGTSKWNKIEHRMLCHITQNWRGQPLQSRMAIVELIGATTAKGGLKVECALDERHYEKGIHVKKAAMKLLDIEGDAFHPEWNYTIKRRRLDDL